MTKLLIAHQYTHTDDDVVSFRSTKMIRFSNTYEREKKKTENTCLERVNLKVRLIPMEN